MTHQLDLLPPRAPAVGEEDVITLLYILSDGGWLTADRIAAELTSQTRLTWSDRKIRAVAAASAGRVISGQAGYKLTHLATIAEVQHATAWLRSQADEMRARAMAIDRIYHRKLRPAA